MISTRQRSLGQARRELDGIWAYLAGALPAEHPDLLAYLHRMREWSGSLEGIERMLEHNPQFTAAMVQVAVRELCWHFAKNQEVC